MANLAAAIAQLGNQAPWLAPLIGAVLGSAFGSFVACARARRVAGQSLRHPPSRCDACHRHLTLPDLIPILSWLLLRGRCRRCGAVIGLTPLLWEAGLTTTGLLLGLLYGLTLWLVPALIITFSLLAATLLFI